MVPGRFGTGSGLLIDTQFNQSPQTDIVIFEHAMEPALFAQTTQLLHPIESVYACIEVKTSLQAQDLVDFAERTEKLRSLEGARTHADGSTAPINCLFAYTAWALPTTVKKHVFQLDPSVRPDVMIIVDQGLVGGAPDQTGWDGYDLRLALVLDPSDSATPTPLHATNDDLVDHLGGAYLRYRAKKDDYYYIDSARALSAVF